MSFTGEINQHLQGNRANVDRLFSTLKLIGNLQATSTTSGTLQILGGLGLTGNIFCGGTGNISGLLTGNSGLTITGTSTLNGSVTSAFNTVDDGTGGCTFGVDATPTVLELKGIIRIGIANVTNSISIGTQGGRALNFGNANAIVGCLGTIFQINTSGSGTTTIGNTSSTTNLVGPVNINTSGSSAVNIGTGTYTGQVTIGNTSNNLGALIQGGVASNAALTINSTSGGGCYMYVNRTGASSVAYGSSGAAKPIDIYDFGAGNSWLYNNGTHGFVGSAHNTLDDGTGAATFAGTVTVTTSSTVPLILQSTTSGGCTISFLTASGGTNVGSFGYSSVSGLNLTNGAGAFVLRQGAGTNTEKSLYSNNNILDDGTGNMTITGTGDPILRLRRSSYGTNFISRLRFVDDNTSGKYWEIGTDVGGSKGGDLYFYGQGSGGLGLAMQLTSKGYLYLGYGAAQFQTTESTLAAGNQTVTAAQMLGYFIFSPSQTGNFIWTFDTGTNIYTAMGSPPVGTTVPFLLTNGTAFSCIFAFGTGVTNKLRTGSITNSTLMCYARVTGTNTIDLISQ